MKFLRLERGDIPVVISVPHGGYLFPKDLPIREIGCFLKDGNTISTLLAIKKAFLENRMKPYFIYSRLSRKYLDLNRGPEELDDSKIKKIWSSYHLFIADSLKEVKFKHQKGVYIDLHGQSTRDYIELGYGEVNLRNDFISKNSFGYALNKNGLNCYPSPLMEVQAGRYRSGGFSVRHHRANNLLSVQVELDRASRINKTERLKFSKKFVRAIEDYLSRK